jgi:hypothetical protein
MKRMKRSLPFLVSLAVLAPIALRAAIPPAAGPDFRVSTTSQSSQSGVDVARDAAGDSIYVWIDQAVVPQAVVARVFNAAGVPQQLNIYVAFDNQPLSRPRVAATPQGEFVVVWANRTNVFLKRFDRLGRPLGLGAITQQLTPGEPSSPDVAIDPAGNAFVVWAVFKLDGDVIYLQRFDAADHALSLPEPVNQSFSGGRNNPRVTVNPSGSLLVSWDDFRAGNTGDVWARRFDGPTGAWSPEARVDENSPGFQLGSAPLLDSNGSGAVVYTDLTAAKVLVRRIDAAGAPAGASILLGNLGGGTDSAPDAAMAEDGTTLVVWEAGDLLVHARFFDGAQWNPLAPELLVSSVQTDAELDPSVAAGGSGFSVAWDSVGRPQFFPVPPPPSLINGRDGDSSGVFSQRFQNPVCAGGSEVLCLAGGQFQARVSWKNPYTGETGTGKALPLTGDTGAFWFFSPGNLELMVKVLNGGEINAHYWVFYGSLSNVEYTLTITDMSTGTAKTYHNAPLQLASKSDIEAFPVFVPSSLAALETAAALPATSATLAPAAAKPAGKAEGDCQTTPALLCLSQKRFSVQVEFTDPRDGSKGTARTVTLTDDTGAFWFFGPGNLELMIKVLDGSGVNGHFWVFYGGLSDVEYTITVTELATGKKKVYHNARHQQASVADVQAF